MQIIPAVLNLESEERSSTDFLASFVRYKEHEDGFLRLQLIRYESVELTEQLMRERHSRRAEEDGQSEGLGLDEDSTGTIPSEMQVELRGVLLEEQRAEEPTVGAMEGGQEEAMFCVLAGGLAQGGEDAVMLQLQDPHQQLEMQVV